MATTTSSPEIAPLARPVRALPGVGPQREQQFVRLDIRTVEDLLLHRPRRYEDRRRLRQIANLEQGESVIVRGKVVDLGVKWFARHTKSIFQLVLSDGTARLHCRWWNLPFLEKQYALGEEVVAFGKVAGTKPRAMDHPETEIVESEGDTEDGDISIHFNRITPIYPLTEGMQQRWLRNLIWRTLGELSQESRADLSFTANSPRGFVDPRQLGLASLPSRAEAIRAIHFPEDLDDVEPARQRLAFDEFYELQSGIQLRRRKFESKSEPLPCGGNNKLIKPFLSRLGFKLTEAQTKVLRELRQDMAGAHPMRRLLQGDVGSGKTVVAACCALMAIESGYEVALMAPTEILAEQHFANFQKWFAPLQVPVELRTGAHKSAKPANEIRRNGEATAFSTPPHLTIGTHALIHSGFEPDNLGLVIIDEQHRFGVTQREQLVKKGRYPHLLVMTATPIPRTLGLTLYGELDVSVIEKPPPGRGAIKTFVRGAEKLPQVWSFIRARLREGGQAFVVYPRVDETAESGVKAVTRELANVQQMLKPFHVGLLHGRLKNEEKERVMSEFRQNKVQALLATSLIEVGVDVPNATLMLIENAEQFGLAQLHQLRGRIGRGSHDSHCILVAAAKSKESRERLRVMEETTDGFVIAEADLKLRGPGEMLGQQQSGMPRFRFGNLTTDLGLITYAREFARREQNG